MIVPNEAPKTLWDLDSSRKRKASPAEIAARAIREMGGDMRALANRISPWTSHTAAAALEKSGTTSTRRALLLKLVIEQPGFTAAEYAAMFGRDRNFSAPRLTELKQAGILRAEKPRRCGVTGCTAMTWYFNENDPLLAP